MLLYYDSPAYILIQQQNVEMLLKAMLPLSDLVNDYKRPSPQTSTEGHPSDYSVANVKVKVHAETCDSNTNMNIQGDSNSEKYLYRNITDSFVKDLVCLTHMPDAPERIENEKLPKSTNRNI